MTKGDLVEECRSTSFVHGGKIEINAKVCVGKPADGAQSLDHEGKFTVTSELSAPAAAPSSHGCFKKRKADNLEDDPVARGRLHELYTRILNRPLQPGDIVYKLTSDEQGSVAEVRLPGLPDVLGLKSWTSKACATRRLAREQAAGEALCTLLSHSELLAVAEPLAKSAGCSVLPAEGMGAENLCKETDLKAQESVPDADLKAQVVTFCQWSCSRPMRKTDIVYTTVRHDGQYKAKMILNCLSGEEFVGPARPDRKQAEHAAAALMLKIFERERARMAVEMNKKRRVQADSSCAGQELNARSHQQRLLHDVCGRIIGRHLQPGDVVYEVIGSFGGARVKLQLPCLPGQLARETWECLVCGSRRDARAQVASMALEAIQQEQLVQNE